MSKVVQLGEISEKPHPFLKDVKMRVLLSKRDNNMNATCFVVRCPVGSEIEEHSQPNEEDFIYVLESKATRWIESVGEFPMAPGTFVAVSKGESQRTLNVTRELLIPDFFTPPMF